MSRITFPQVVCVAALLSLARYAAALEPPSFRVYWDGVPTPRIYTPTSEDYHAGPPPYYDVSDELVSAQLYQDQDHESRWHLVLKNKRSTELSIVDFPYDVSDYVLNADGSDDVGLLTWKGGIAYDPDEWGWVVDYPGQAFSPFAIMTDNTSARIIAAINWPPRKITVKCDEHAGRRQTLRESVSLATNETRDFYILYACEQGDWNAGDPPWMRAVDQYSEWLHSKMQEHSLWPVLYPGWMKRTQGMLSVLLENYTDAMLAESPNRIESLWRVYGSTLQWIQFWGQMSGYGEGCCELNQELQSRYGNSGVWDLVGFVTNRVYGGGGGVAAVRKAGYYTRPYPDVPLNDDTTVVADGETNLVWFDQWLGVAKRDWRATAFYHDTMGERSCEDPNFVAELYRDHFSRSTAIEGATDVYPVAFLVSGILSQPGAGFPGGPDATISGMLSSSTTNRVIFPELVSYALNDRIMFDGTLNTGYLWWGSEHHYWVERQVFLLGHKYETSHPDENGVEDWNDAFELAVNARKAVHWWGGREPRYQGTRGITNVPAGVRVRVFRDKNDVNLLAFDRWEAPQGNLTIEFNGQQVSVPSDLLAIVEISEK